MNQKAFTIHTQLIDGCLSGARNIYMGANRTCHLYVLPRNKISYANEIRDIAEHPAFYILIGSENGFQKAYIGQTTDFSSRKNEHVQKKYWWTTALVFISDNHKIYGDDVKFLEYLGIKRAMEAAAWPLFNSSVPKKPNIAPDRINDMQNFFDDIVLLTNFYGVSIFDAPSTEKKEDEKHLFHVSAMDRPAKGSGYFDPTSGKFILLKGCKLAAKPVPSYKFKGREEIIARHCKIAGDEIILQHDYPMDSPSGASGLVLGRPSNGKTDWKDAEGRTLGSFLNEMKSK